MPKKVKVRPAHKPVLGDMQFGQQAALWGHTFQLKPDGYLVCEMDEHIAKLELKNGRCVRYFPEDAQINALDAFTSDIGTYYGAGDLDTLLIKIEKLTKGEINKFCKARLEMEWPASMVHAEMVKNTIDSVRALRSGE